jgi:hypothetical protein
MVVAEVSRSAEGDAFLSPVDFFAAALLARPAVFAALFLGLFFVFALAVFFMRGNLS